MHRAPGATETSTGEEVMHGGTWATECLLSHFAGPAQRAVHGAKGSSCALTPGRKRNEVGVQVIFIILE